MARIARLVAPGLPHHIIQRGNRRQKTFFSEKDYRFYMELMAEWCRKKGTQIWAYCLMPNHVHLIAVPETKEALRDAIGEAHRRYTRFVNFREGWRGHLWQGRFSSYVMDESYLMRCVRYVETNPVRAGLVHRPEKWPWSSAAAHLKRKNDRLVEVEPLLRWIPYDWSYFLDSVVRGEDSELLRKHERTGRPLGSDPFIDRLEALHGPRARPQKPGPKPEGER
jgi:putative transposase